VEVKRDSRGWGLGEVLNGLWGSVIDIVLLQESGFVWVHVQLKESGGVWESGVGGVGSSVEEVF
jgi:hypothetical protein